MNIDQKFMHRCLELASLGWPRCRPNPMVGSVIVHNGAIIGEGYHHRYGASHAEVMAIQSVEDESLLSESTLYVNLEPCSHFGKTPPCADLIVEKKIKKVVIATIDSTSKVCGKGIDRLKENHIEVVVGVLEKEARKRNERFFCFHEKKRPYIVLKWAESADGFIDAKRESTRQKAKKISGPMAHQLVHLWRMEEAAILVGGRTVRTDNPQLNVRLVKGPNPLRVILSPSGNIGDDALVRIDGQPTLIFNQDKEGIEDAVEWIQIDFKKSDSEDGWMDDVLSNLHQRGIQSLLVEGGRETLQRFITADMWDDIRQFTSDKILKEGVAAPLFSLTTDDVQWVGSDQLRLYNRR